MPLYPEPPRFPGRGRGAARAFVVRGAVMP